MSCRSMGLWTCLALAPVAVLLSTCHPAAAAAGDTWLSLRIANSSPIGTAADELDPALAWGASLTRFGSSHAGMGVEVMSQNWRASESSLAAYSGLFGSDVSLTTHALQLIAHVHAEPMPFASVRPYVRIRAGMLMLRTGFFSRQTGSIPGDRETRAAMGMGVGVSADVAAALALGVFADYFMLTDDGPAMRYAHLGAELRLRVAH